MEQGDKISFQVKEHGIVLAGGIFVIGFVLFILVMGLRYPSAGGNRPVFIVTLAVMMTCGILVCVMYFHRRLVVEEMNICYVNFFGKQKNFSLNDIGYCKLGLSGSKKEPHVESIIVYDLMGEKLCKLEINMPGARKFLQYIVDNQIRTEWMEAGREPCRVREPEIMVKTICQEEISRYTEKFYDMISPVFTDWEKRYQRFDACWEFGFVEYAQGEITAQKDMWQWESTVQSKAKEELPEDYICIVEVYLKRGEEYVMNRKGAVTGFLIPYIWQNKSYQVGENRRIRKMDEAWLLERLADRLQMMAEELPRHSYHTQTLSLGHELHKRAGKLPEVSRK